MKLPWFHQNNSYSFLVWVLIKSKANYFQNDTQEAFSIGTQRNVPRYNMLVKITTAVIPIARYQFRHFMFPDIFFGSNKLTPNCQMRKLQTQKERSGKF
ncbi:MAG: hypothetical protein AUH84_00710 [Thaumarchaeota archaeon 13_1_40CM_4_38_7]|nr:MAG: hypothetical protein AUH84_00710 [Thaumarchaeota archaeon 13_1_40CM_4_38_7]OLE39143.1 MAG: hypothetical protein AUF74_02340 [Thaumarchaeota archaeon 13_1_20CM_2_38_5]